MSVVSCARYGVCNSFRSVQDVQMYIFTEEVAFRLHITCKTIFVSTFNNLVPRVLSYPPYVGRVGENLGNEVGLLRLFKTLSRGTQREYSSKPLKRRLVELILPIHIAIFLSPKNFLSVRISQLKL